MLEAFKDNWHMKFINNPLDPFMYDGTKLERYFYKNFQKYNSSCIYEREFI